MPNTIDWEPASKVIALVYGRFKTGKTWGALTFPRPNVIDLDRGIATSRNPEFVKKYGMRSIEYDQFKDKYGPGGVPLTHDAFDTACVYFDKWMKPGYVEKFDTWVLDSGTTLSRAAMHKAIILLGGSSLSIKSATHTEAKATGLVVPRIQDYGAERSMVTQFIQQLVESGKHVLVLCHEREIMGDSGRTKSIVPLLTGKGVEEIPLMFDEVWCTRVRPKGESREYYLQTKPDGLRNLGSRYGVPDGIAFEWGAINSALSNIRNTQREQAKKAKEK